MHITSEQDVEVIKYVSTTSLFPNAFNRPGIHSMFYFKCPKTAEIGTVLASAERLSLRKISTRLHHQKEITAPHILATTTAAVSRERARVAAPLGRREHRGEAADPCPSPAPCCDRRETEPDTPDTVTRHGSVTATATLPLPPPPSPPSPQSLPRHLGQSRAGTYGRSRAATLTGRRAETRPRSAD